VIASEGAGAVATACMLYGKALAMCISQLAVTSDDLLGSASMNMPLATERSEPSLDKACAIGEKLMSSRELMDPV